MSFDYDKVSKHSEHSSWWTSYADLFMMLSIVFLLMYVASSLRSGSAGYQQQVEYKKLSQKAQDLEEQIRVYNTLKDEALKKQSTEAEQQVYSKLMDKLSLLQDEAHQEKLSLEAKAKENSEKEFALNQYQQLIRNIVNANILAKSQIIHRDQLIVSKDATIEEKRQKIAEMGQVIAQNEAQISKINSQLDQQIKNLRAEQHHSKTSKATLEKRIAELRRQSEGKIQALEGANQGISLQLSQVKSTLDQTASKLGEATQTIAQQQQEVGNLSTQLKSDHDRYVAELEGLKKQHDDQLAAERAAFDANLKKQRLSAAERSKKLANFLKGEQEKAAALEGQLSGLRSKVADTEKRLNGAQNDLAGAQAEKNRALASVENLKGDLARTRELANARKKLAQQIADQFAKSGMKGAVDARTGEVTLDFGGEYFDTGSANLKPKMRVTLDKFMPIYAKSLFNDPKIAAKIGSVEIIGFASSTFKGRYVNPKSIRPEDKEAIEYNLKLSFGRANAIFKHVINQNELSQKDREQLMPLLKVVGRGYLPDGKSASDLPDHMTEQEFCSRYNCKQAQKVVVKFNMKD
ncbi:MAG: hypothetical protein P4M08_10510 [Oligoflexia bacterium]|nr:hypothetical protein [Oligoflexia bacterium]